MRGGCILSPAAASARTAALMAAHRVPPSACSTCVRPEMKTSRHVRGMGCLAIAREHTKSRGYVLLGVLDTSQGCGHAMHKLSQTLFLTPLITEWPLFRCVCVCVCCNMYIPLIRPWGITTRPMVNFKTQSGVSEMTTSMCW